MVENLGFWFASNSSQASAYHALFVWKNRVTEQKAAAKAAKRGQLETMREFSNTAVGSKQGGQVRPAAWADAADAADAGTMSPWRAKQNAVTLLARTLRSACRKRYTTSFLALIPREPRPSPASTAWLNSNVSSPSHSPTRRLHAASSQDITSSVSNTLDRLARARRAIGAIAADSSLDAGLRSDPIAASGGGSSSVGASRRLGFEPVSSPASSHRPLPRLDLSPDPAAQRTSVGEHAQLQQQLNALSDLIH